MLGQIENGMEYLQIGEVDVARGFGSSGAMRSYGTDVSSMGRFRGEIRGQFAAEMDAECLTGPAESASEGPHLPDTLPPWRVTPKGGQKPVPRGFSQDFRWKYNPRPPQSTMSS